MSLYESCNLGLVNLGKFIIKKSYETKINWERLKFVIEVGGHFLDDVISANHYPIEKIKQVTLSNREIRLRVMSFADMLFQLQISCDSKMHCI